VLELIPGSSVFPPSSPTGFTESPDLVLLVERALEKDERTRGTALDILARGGTVVLMGCVSADSVKDAAERLTRSVPGVTDVDNRIQIMI
jgi:osmotically-inducible protein OsmY